MAKAKILLVEDDKLQAKVAKDYLESSDYEIIWVENGKSAIKTAKTQPIDLILLDLVLPDLDGNEVARWLKHNEDTKGIPIIILTVKGSTMEKVAGLEAGADDYLPKPYNEIELNARIYACLRTKALQDELRKKNRQLEEVLLKVESRILTAISSHNFSGIPRQITLSIGVASIPESTIDSVEKFIHASDLALYEAKANGRNSIEVA